MNINRNNYEIYFLDYWENQLSSGEIAELMLFLEENPDLKIEFEEYENFTLSPDQDIQFESKVELKKNPVVEVKDINQENYQSFIIASIENDLNSEQESQLELFLGMNPSLTKEYEFFKKTKLIPDNTILYDDKESVYKKTFFINRKKLLYYTSAAAAMILLFFSIYLNIDKNNKDDLLVRYDHELKYLEKDITNEITFPEKGSDKYHEHDYNNGVERIVNENPEKRMKSGKGNKNINSDQNNIKVEKIDKITVAEVLIDNENDDIVECEDRDYVSDVFNNSVLLALNKEEEGTETEEPQTFLGYALSGLTKIFRKDNPVENESSKLSFWDIADAGIEGFNKITQKDIDMKREYDGNGNMTSLAIVSDGFEIFRKKPPKNNTQNN